MSAGLHHTVVLRSDGTAIACGYDGDGQCDIPPLEAGSRYVQASAGGHHSLFLRDDGTAVACGCNDEGQCDIPPLDEGVDYVQISAGGFHSVLLQSDGRAVTCGRQVEGQCNVLSMKECEAYLQVSAGMYHTILLRSDGQAVTCGSNHDGQCSIPALEEGQFYTQVSAGGSHSAFLRSDGLAVACGRNDEGQCNIPDMGAAVRYVQVSASLSGVGAAGRPVNHDGDISSAGHTLLRCDDGKVVCCGHDYDYQCRLPSAPPGVAYSNVSAGGSHSVLLRTDGEADTSGYNGDAQCSVPRCRTWSEWWGSVSPSIKYVCDAQQKRVQRRRVLQADIKYDCMRIRTLSGEEVTSLAICEADPISDIQSRLIHNLNNVDSSKGHDVLLPNGKLLGSMAAGATLADVIPRQQPFS